MKKTCTKCGETKLVSEFYKAGKGQGRKKTCKLCCKARRAELDAMTPQQRSIARLKAREAQKRRWQRISEAISAKKRSLA